MSEPDKLSPGEVEKLTLHDLTAEVNKRIYKYYADEIGAFADSALSSTGALPTSIDGDKFLQIAWRRFCVDNRPALNRWGLLSGCKAGEVIRVNMPFPDVTINGVLVPAVPADAPQI